MPIVKYKRFLDLLTSSTADAAKLDQKTYQYAVKPGVVTSQRYPTSVQPCIADGILGGNIFYDPSSTHKIIIRINLETKEPQLLARCELTEFPKLYFYKDNNKLSIEGSKPIIGAEQKFASIEEKREVLFYNRELAELDLDENSPKRAEQISTKGWILTKPKKHYSSSDSKKKLPSVVLRDTLRFEMQQANACEIIITDYGPPSKSLGVRHASEIKDFKVLQDGSTLVILDEDKITFLQLQSDGNRYKISDTLYPEPGMKFGDSLGVADGDQITVFVAKLDTPTKPTIKGTKTTDTPESTFSSGEFLILSPPYKKLNDNDFKLIDHVYEKVKSSKKTKSPGGKFYKELIEEIEKCINSQTIGLTLKRDLCGYLIKEVLPKIENDVDSKNKLIKVYQAYLSMLLQDIKNDHFADIASLTKEVDDDLKKLEPEKYYKGGSNSSSSQLLKIFAACMSMLRQGSEEPFFLPLEVLAHITTALSPVIAGLKGEALDERRFYFAVVSVVASNAGAASVKGNTKIIMGLFRFFRHVLKKSSSLMAEGVKDKEEKKVRANIKKFFDTIVKVIIDSIEDQNEQLKTLKSYIGLLVDFPEYGNMNIRDDDLAGASLCEAITHRVKCELKSALEKLPQSSPFENIKNVVNEAIYNFKSYISQIRYGSDSGKVQSRFSDAENGIGNLITELSRRKNFIEVVAIAYSTLHTLIPNDKSKVVKGEEGFVKALQEIMSWLHFEGEGKKSLLKSEMQKYYDNKEHPKEIRKPVDTFFISAYEYQQPNKVKTFDDTKSLKNAPVDGDDKNLNDFKSKIDEVIPLFKYTPPEPPKESENVIHNIKIEPGIKIEPDDSFEKKKSMFFSPSVTNKNEEVDSLLDELDKDVYDKLKKFNIELIEIQKKAPDSKTKQEVKESDERVTASELGKPLSLPLLQKQEIEKRIKITKEFEALLSLPVKEWDLPKLIKERNTVKNGLEEIKKIGPTKKGEDLKLPNQSKTTLNIQLELYNKFITAGTKLEVNAKLNGFQNKGQNKNTNLPQ
jgi:hypothetical protein